MQHGGHEEEVLDSGPVVLSSTGDGLLLSWRPTDTRCIIKIIHINAG